MQTRFDHIVVGALTLESGLRYVESELGVRVPPGGEHPLMATHNRLMRLSEEAFLEIIAPNPEALAARPRWYGLDDPYVQASLRRSPRLLGWVVNTSDLTTLVAKSSFDFGVPTEVSRGDLRWHFGIPDDGRLLAAGLLPYLIEWQTDRHPAHQMPDLGCRLEALRLFHPYPGWLKNSLKSIGAEAPIEVKTLPGGEAPYLEAELGTPSGDKTLSSRLA